MTYFQTDPEADKRFQKRKAQTTSLFNRVNENLQTLLSHPCPDEAQQLTRQALALDEAFQLLMQMSFKIYEEADMINVNEDYLKIAVQIQRQCVTTHQSLQAKRYMDSLIALNEGKKDALPHQPAQTQESAPENISENMGDNRGATPHPLYPSEQTGLGESDN